MLSYPTHTSIPHLCGGVNPHTLHNKIFIKEIINKIPKKHKLYCHTRLILLIPQLCTYDNQGPVSLPDIHIFQVGLNPHTLHTKIFRKEILNKIPKKHNLSCHTRHVLLIPGLCGGKPAYCAYQNMY